MTITQTETQMFEDAVDGWVLQAIACGVQTFNYQLIVSLPVVYPSLISVVPGDVLQSVSRRDPRRQLADVWTLGNRIFACQGRGVLWQILEAMAIGRSPNEAVALALKRPLSFVAAELVSYATHQIINIISTEQKENLLFEEERNNTKLFLATG